METLIRQANFFTTDKDEQIKFGDACERKPGHDRTEICDILNALKDVVSTEEFPNDMGCGTYMVIYALRSALYSMSDDDETNGIYENVFNIYIACLEHGPTSGHLSVMGEIGRIITIKQLSKAIMDSQQLGRVFRALQRSWTPHSCEENIPGYLDCLDTRLHLTVFDQIIPCSVPDERNSSLQYHNATNTKKSAIDNQLMQLHRICNVVCLCILDDLDLLELGLLDLLVDDLELLQSQAAECARLFAHCQNEAAIQCERLIRLNSRVMDHISRKLDKVDAKLYMLLGTSDSDLVKEHIQMIDAILEREDFPKHGYSKGMIERWLRWILAPLTNKPELGQLYYTNLLQLREKLLSSPKQDAQYLGTMLAENWKYIHPSVLKENVTPLKDEVEVMKTMVLSWERNPGTIKEVERRLQKDILPKFTNKADAEILLELTISLIESHQIDYIKLVPKILQHKPKLIIWKEHTQKAVQIYEVLRKFCQEEETNDTLKKEKLEVSDKVASKCFDLLKTAKLNKELTPVLFEILLEALKGSTDALLKVAFESIELIDWKVVKERSSEALGLVLQNIEAGSLCGDRTENFTFKGLHGNCVSQCIDQLSGPKLPESYKEVMQKIMNALINFDLEGECGTNECGLIAIYCLKYVTKNGTDPSCIDKIISSVLRLCESPNDNLMTFSKSVLGMTLKPHHHLLENYADQLLDLYLELNQLEALDCLTAMYPKGADIIHEHLTTMLNKLDDMNDTMEQRMCLNSLSALLLKVATQNPQVFNKDHMVFLCNQMNSFSHSMLPIYLKLAKSRLDLMKDELDFLLEFGNENNAQLENVREVLTCLGLKKEKIAEHIILSLVDLLESHKTEAALVILTIMQTLGVEHSILLIPHKQIIQSLQSDAELKPVCTNLLDTIAGRSLVALSTQVTQQQEELDDVKEDVAATGEEVDQLEQRVTAHDEDIDHIKEDVTKTEDRLDAVEETVEETAEKVEELDHKTMSNAPAWSRDVSRLLNPEAAHDWRLLGQRLGYTNDDIRGWATQNDPCMSLLSEWFATHRTSEATHGVLKALEEMNRTDAAEIVQQALEDVGDVVEDEEEMTGPLPPIFLSYEWGRQAEVLLLRRHLEMAGFRCWMDLGQMGGGDKLYSKIDAGMRASKVLICCVTEKYAKSDNCNREVNLAVTLGKSILPLLMTQMSWPPEGAMGPIFGEYLFIRMFQRPHERTDDTRYWPQPKFQELLMQLRYHIVPDEDLITDEYSKWWEPKEEVIVVPKERTAGELNGDPKPLPKQPPDEETTESCPQVFLSYQWGKQPQVKALYRRLTQLGYTCWIDINQMGGGDSLYDKIDRGIRGCHVVLPCVTSKYTMSANCRRELSLADAIKKPVVPLLLENLVWPPAGPMSMVFAQLLYIDFQQDSDIQNTWTGPAFNELIQKLNTFVPGEMNITSGDGGVAVMSENIDQLSHDSKEKPTDTNATSCNDSQTSTESTVRSQASCNEQNSECLTQEQVVDRTSLAYQEDVPESQREELSSNYNDGNSPQNNESDKSSRSTFTPEKCAVEMTPEHTHEGNAEESGSQEPAASNSDVHLGYDHRTDGGLHSHAVDPASSATSSQPHGMELPSPATSPRPHVLEPASPATSSQHHGQQANIVGAQKSACCLIV